MEILINRHESPYNWNQHLHNNSGSIFMTKEWLDTISSSERIPLYIRFSYEGEIVAVLGGIELLTLKGTRKQLFFYSGIVAKNKDAGLIKKCKSTLYKFARKNKYFRISIRSYDHQSYFHAKVKQFRAEPRSEYITFLNNHNNEIINFDREIKRIARKAKREGVVFKKSSSESLTENLFSLLNETYNKRKSKGYGDYSFLFLPFFNKEEVHKLVASNNATFYYAEFQNEILSIQLVFEWEKRAYAIFMGTSPAGYKANAPAFLVYETTWALKNQKYQYYNHGGIPRGQKNEGIRRFKKDIGAIPVFSSEEVTNFMTFPLYLLNTLLSFKFFLLNLNIFPWSFKKAVINLIDSILKKRDEY